MEKESTRKIDDLRSLKDYFQTNIDCLVAITKNAIDTRTEESESSFDIFMNSITFETAQSRENLKNLRGSVNGLEDVAEHSDRSGSHLTQVLSEFKTLQHNLKNSTDNLCKYQSSVEMEMDLTSNINNLKRLKNRFDSSIDRFVSELNDACDTHTEEWNRTFDFYVTNIRSQLFQTLEVWKKLDSSVNALKDVAEPQNIRRPYWRQVLIEFDIVKNNLESTVDNMCEHISSDSEDPLGSNDR